MSRRASIRQADVKRVVRGALQGATAAGANVSIVIEGGRITIVPVDAAPGATEADDLEKRMVEHFGA